MLVCFATILYSCKENITNKHVALKDAKNQLTRPNIIIILADDAGFIDFGFMGSKDLQTPNIDKLAMGGVTFTDAHVTATVCAPSRAGLITGKYQQLFGFEANGTGGIGLSDDVQTMGTSSKKMVMTRTPWGNGIWAMTDPISPTNGALMIFLGSLRDHVPIFPLKILQKIKRCSTTGSA